MMLKIILWGLILYTNLVYSCCRKPPVIRIEDRLANKTYFFQITKKMTQSELRNLILAHQSEILRYQKILKYKPEDYYIAAYYKSSGEKILTISDSPEKLGGRIIAALYENDVIINVAPRPYCKPVEIKDQIGPDLIDSKQII